MNRQTRIWWGLALGLLVVLLRGLFIAVMDVDASQYASISMEMLQSGSWLQVLHRHADYLDKPPLLFWSAAASYTVFGYQTWAYKLPSLLGVLGGVWAVYRFTRLYYTPATARNAAFILASSLGFVLMSNDVRTDALLLGMSACAVWQLAEYQLVRQLKNLLLAGLFVGLAMLAKGPIGAVLPAAAVLTHAIFRRDWRAILHVPWLWVGAVTALVLLPMCWGLYQQFDLHPEKEVNGRHGVSGLYFFFWEQSFGRITGENVWRNDTSVFTFLHVYLWAFLPWVALLVNGLVQQTRQLIQQKWRLTAGQEAYSLGAFVLVFVALSLSKYKLPHYIFVTLPWAAVLAAAGLERYRAEWRSNTGWRVVQLSFYLLGLLAAGAALWLAAGVFPTLSPLIWVPVLALLGLFIWWGRPLLFGAERTVQGGVALGLLVGFVLNFHFYPQLLPYQSTSEAGKWLHEQGIPKHQLAFMGQSGHALEFYSQTIQQQILTPQEALEMAARTGGTVWLYCDAESRTKFDEAKIPYEVAHEWGHFQVALLRAPFLNPATRDQSLRPVSVLKIQAPPNAVK